jgi:hypothetical protein
VILVLVPLLLTAAHIGTTRLADPSSSQSPDADTEMRDTAIRFLDSLSPGQQAKAAQPFDSTLRAAWHFLPLWAHPRTVGVKLEDLSDEQRASVHRILQVGLSDRGYLKASGIVMLDDVLRSEVEALLESGAQIEGLGPEQARRFGSENYVLTVFGDPSSDKPWGWRFEGHHLTLNFTSVDGMVIGTPTFMGSNPARVLAGSYAGWRVLAAEEDLGRAFIASLTDDQKEAAYLSTETPADVIAGPGARDRLKAIEGLPALRLSGEQQAGLRRLIEQFAGNLRAELAIAELEAMEVAGFENVHFAWAGGTGPEELLYYRVHGPTLLIEFDNTLNSPNHIHTIFRGRDDLGVDLLKQHYGRSPH